MQYLSERELTLVEVFHALRLRWKLIAAGSLFLMVAGGILYSLGANRFQARALFQIGIIPGMGYIESQESVIQQVREQFTGYGSTGAAPVRLQSIRGFGKDSSFIEVIVESKDRDIAGKTLSSITDFLLGRHERLSEAPRAQRKLDLSLVDQAIEELSKQLSALSKVYQSNQTNPSAFVITEKYKAMEQLLSLRRERAKLAMVESDRDRNLTKVIHSSVYSLSDFRKIVVRVVLYAVAGALMAAFFILVVEFGLAVPKK